MDTRTHILDTGEALMKRSGFSGFSYAAIADAVGIRKASIHYHFPTKAHLAAAAVARYREATAEALGDPTALTAPADAVDRMGAVFEDAWNGPGTGCLCGSLAADWAALPETVQAGVAAYWRDAVSWLEAAGVSPENARLVFALLEGAMLSARVAGDGAILKAATAAARGLLGTA